MKITKKQDVITLSGNSDLKDWSERRNSNKIKIEAKVKYCSIQSEFERVELPYPFLSSKLFDEMARLDAAADTKTEQGQYLQKLSDEDFRLVYGEETEHELSFI